MKSGGELAVLNGGSHWYFVVFLFDSLVDRGSNGQRVAPSVKVR